MVKKYQPLYSRVKIVADRVGLQFATLSIGAGPDHKAAMLFISRSTEPFRVRDLPKLSAQQQIELARSLIASGFLVRVSDWIQPPDEARRPRPLDAGQARLFRARPGGRLGRPDGRTLRRTVLRPDGRSLGLRPACPAAGQDWARGARRSRWRAVARAGGHDLSPLAVRIYARVPAPGHTSWRRRRRAGAAQRAPRARSRSGRRGPRWSGLCGSWCGRSAAAGTATNGGWCSSARAGTSVAGRSSPPPFQKHPGSESSATRRASWRRSSPNRRDGAACRPRPNAPHGVSALIRPWFRP